MKAGAVLAVTASALMLLAGCQTLIQQHTNGPWVGIAPGSTLTLRRAVQVPRGRARVFFVNGRVRGFGANYTPACALEVRQIDAQAAQTIQPGGYRIVRAQNYWTEVADAADPNRIRFRLADHDSDGGYSMIQTGYHFWLEGQDRNVKRLTCLGVLNDPAVAYPPTIEEIGAALGRWATLELSATPKR